MGEILVVLDDIVERYCVTPAKTARRATQRANLKTILTDNPYRFVFHSPKIVLFDKEGVTELTKSFEMYFDVNGTVIKNIDPLSGGVCATEELYFEIGHALLNKKYKIKSSKDMIEFVSKKFTLVFVIREI